LTEAPHFYIFDLNLNTLDAAALVFLPFRLIPPGIRQQVSCSYKGITFMMAERMTLLTLYPSFLRVSVNSGAGHKVIEGFSLA
jgi:hypothetical protein